MASCVVAITLKEDAISKLGQSASAVNFRGQHSSGVGVLEQTHKLREEGKEGGRKGIPRHNLKYTKYRATWDLEALPGPVKKQKGNERK